MVRRTPLKLRGCYFFSSVVVVGLVGAGLSRHRRPEVPNALAQSLTQLTQLLGAENEECDAENQKELGQTDLSTKHKASGK